MIEASICGKTWDFLTQGSTASILSFRFLWLFFEMLRIHFHQIFKKLKQSDPITLRVGPNEVSTASMTRLVKNHRKWVAKILVLLLDLAGYKDTVTWDGFIYVTMQFCSLSKLELCQVMFYIVSKEMKSWTVHYVTSSQLEEFYDDYYTCPVAAFNTNSIDFAKLPLAKYRMQDYIELCYRRISRTQSNPSWLGFPLRYLNFGSLSLFVVVFWLLL